MLIPISWQCWKQFLSNAPPKTPRLSVPDRMIWYKLHFCYTYLSHTPFTIHHHPRQKPIPDLSSVADPERTH